MRVQLYYESGSYSVFDTTLLSYQDDILADDSYLDATDIEGKGLLVVRSAHVPDEEEDVVKRMQLSQPITVATPEEIRHIYAVEVDGLMQFVRLGDDLVPVAREQVMRRFDGGDGADEY